MRRFPGSSFAVCYGPLHTTAQLIEDDDGVWLVVAGAVKLSATSRMLSHIALVDATEEEKERLRRAGFNLKKDADET